MPDIKFLTKVSRPRFWLYLFGPYIVGLAAAASVRDDLLRWDVLLFGIYFLFPANLLIYGINDIFDFETDRLNPKKAEYEMLVRPESHRGLATAIVILNLPFIIAAFVLVPHALPSLAGFIFFSVFYSAPPIRAKAIPIVDSLFNILYVFPAAFAYQMLTGSFPPIAIFIAAGLWTMAMHAYSAIPDIKSDEEAGISTIATALGQEATHYFCAACYLVSSLICLGFGSPVGVLGILYVGLMRHSSHSLDHKIFSIYRYFPVINAICGFIIFLLIAWPKFF